MSVGEAKVDELIEVILHHEGGFVNHKNDRGGATNHGVTIGTYSRWLGRPATVDEVRQMSVETAIEIYKKNYFYGPGIHRLPELVMGHVFDMAVNHGPRRAIKLLQRTVNVAGFGTISVDGVSGPGTRRHVQKAVDAMGEYFNDAVVEERIKFYHRIVERNESQRVFLRGWLRRANSFRMITEG